MMDVPHPVAPPLAPARRGGLLWRWLAAALLALFLLATPALAEQRVALLIGNAAYTDVPPLENPVNDARDVADALESLNFRVFLGEDLTGAGMRALFDSFTEAAADADVALFFYAGHGMQAGARNYLVPVDATLESAEAFLRHAIPLDELLEAMEHIPGIRLIFLDACRDNPLGSAGEDGLARVGSAADFLFAFATQPDNVAYDGLGRNSFFTEALLSRIHTPGQDISELMIGVRRDVLSATGGRQIPWENSSLTRQFRFLPGQETVSPETMLWQLASRAEDPVLMHLYLERFPQGAHVADVQSFLQVAEADIGGGSAVRRLAGTGEQEAERLWALAQRTRMRPLAERYLQLFPDGANAADARRLLDALPAAQDEAPVRQCERLATHPRDATANTAGVEFDVLARNAGAAVAACAAAVAAYPEVPHLTALLARARAASGDRDEALTLYRRAVAAGDLRAMVSLALLHEAGDGVPRDLDAALRLYEQAAEGGSPDAAINLAVALFEGRGVEPDPPRAIALFEKAAAAGSPFAIFNLGVLALRGLVETETPALELFLRAAREGEPRGYRTAALILQTGVDVPPDPVRAGELLLRAVASDDGSTLAELTQTESTWHPATVLALQEHLLATGHYDGALDGATGPGLESALRRWRNGGFLLGAAN